MDEDKSTITLETLLEDNKNIKETITSLSSKLEEMINFKKALLANNGNPVVAKPEEVEKAEAMKKVEAFIKEEI